jgi:predicted deacylase
VAGLNRVLEQLGMIEPRSPIGRAAEADVLSRFLWLRCRGSGWWEPAVVAGEQIAAGQVLGTVSSLDGAVVRETVVAPANGVVIFLTSSPAVADEGLLLGLGAR